MVEDGLVLSMVMIMSEQEDFGRLCATVRDTQGSQGRRFTSQSLLDEVTCFEQHFQKHRCT